MDDKFNQSTIDTFINSLFDEKLSNSDKYDQQVLSKIKFHLGAKNIHSKAGANLAEDLFKLGNSRLVGEE